MGPGDIPEDVLRSVIDSDAYYHAVYNRPGEHSAWFIQSGLTPVPRAYQPTSLAEIQFYLAQAGMRVDAETIYAALAALGDPFLEQRRVAPALFRMPEAQPCG